MQAPAELVERYVALWNEPEADARRHLVRELWAADGAQILQPPQEMLDFRWEMVPAAGGEPAGIGLEFLVLDADGRIRADYQFIER